MRRAAARGYDPEDLDFLRQEALASLVSMPRESALAACVKLCGLSWARSARRAGTLEAVCLGRFDLPNPEDESLPWPAVSFLFRVLAVPGRPLRVAWCSLYLGPDMKWRAVAVEPQDGKPLEVDWRMYVGDPDGPPGVVNGDADATPPGPASAPASPPEPSAPLPPAAPPPPAPMRRSLIGSRRPRRRRTPAPPGTAGSSTPSASAPSAGSVGREMRTALVLELLRFLNRE